MKTHENRKNKRIAVVSCYFHHNYGSVLQALATQMVLDKLGYVNETIDISGIQSEIRASKIKYYIKASLSSGFLLSKYGRLKSVISIKYSNSFYAKCIKMRSEEFDKFRHRYFRLSDIVNSKDALSAYVLENYTTVLVGSDQLWLPVNIAADYYTLNWVPNGINTIAYATSFGQSILPRKTAKSSVQFLRRIKHIGVREESGQKLVKQISKREVPIVCDPALLLSAEEWMTIQQDKRIVEEPYILSYLLGNNPTHRHFVTRMKKETGYKIVALVHLDEFVKEDEGYADYTPYDISPGGFLNLIRNANFVCTDSFHCTAFALLYERDLFAFRRYSMNNYYSTNDRIDTLLKGVGAYNRILSGNEMISECLKQRINYQAVKNNLDVIRKRSYEYLVESIDDVKGTDI